MRNQSRLTVAALRCSVPLLVVVSMENRHGSPAPLLTQLPAGAAIVNSGAVKGAQETRLGKGESRGTKCEQT